jgi:hypothetical protein
MGLVDDIFAAAAASTVTIGQPKILGSYGFGDGVPQTLEDLVNQFAPILGFPQVPVDGVIDPTDATRLVQIQRALYTKYSCDSAQRSAGIAKLEAELDSAAIAAKAEQGIIVTPEQMWVSDNQNGILAKLPPVYDAITTGQIKPCGVGSRTLLWGAVLLGGFVLFSGERPRRRRRNR